MEVIIKNKTSDKIKIKIENSEIQEIEKDEELKINKPEGEHEIALLPIKNNHPASEEQGENKIENPANQLTKKMYRFKSPSILEFYEEDVLQIIDCEKTSLKEFCSINASEATVSSLEEKKPLLQSIFKDKKICPFFEKLKPNDYVFLNNNREKIYKFKELKYSPNKTIEAILIDEQAEAEEAKETAYGCFKNKFSYLAKMNIKIIHENQLFFEKSIVLNINEKLENIYDIIFKEARHLIYLKDFRLVYKDEDISCKNLNSKYYQIISAEDENNENNNVRKISKASSASYSEDRSEASGEGCSEEHESRSDITDSSHNSNNSDDEAQESNCEDDEENSCQNSSISNEVSNDESSSSSIPDKSHSKAAKHNKSKKQNYLEYKGKNLIDLKFNFTKDFLCVIVPKAEYKIFNLTNGSDINCDSWKDRDFVNVLTVSHDLLVKNFYISSINNGEIIERNPPEFNVYLYECEINPEKYKISKNISESQYSNSEKYDFNEFITKKKWIGQNLLFEKLKLNAKNLQQDAQMSKHISDNGFFIETKEFTFSKDKIYCFVGKLQKNSNYFDSSTFYSNPNFIHNKDDEDLKLYVAAKDNIQILFGFYFKYLLGKNH